MPNVPLQPGSTDKVNVKALQQYLVQNGYLTQAQMDTGPGTYGPATTAAVTKLQQALGVDNSSGVGYYGPKTISAVQTKSTAPGQAPNAVAQLQASLGLPQTGVFDAATSTAMNGAITKSLSSNPDVAQYAGNNAPDAILNAYQTGDWSGVTSLTGKPFTDEQQQAAVKTAESALAPAYQAQQAKDTADVSDTIRQTTQGLADTEAADKTQFGKDKNTLDQNAADQGVLFAGSRVQKLNDLRTTYQQRDAINRRIAGDNVGSAARGYQYTYGDDAAKNISSLYNVQGSPTYNANVAGGKVTSSPALSSVYNPGAYNFQGTAPVAQKAAVQTRAANLLANKANKLTLSGVGAKF